MQIQIDLKRVETIQFETEEAAISFRRENGGWIFLFEGEIGGVWFNVNKYTPSKILVHPSIKGKNGKLL